MHKKLETDLMSLAHSILQMKNKDDVFALQKKAQEIYEKLSLLAFVKEYVNQTPNIEKTEEELLAVVEKAIEKKDAVVDKIAEDTVNKTEKIVHQLEEKKEEIIEQPFDELQELMFTEEDTATNFKNDVKDVGQRKTPTLEEELQDTVSVDVTVDLFENAQPKSLNDKLVKNIQIGLNDRIAFVKNLFNGSQEDFNRVVSQLNTFKTEKEAKKFINKMVKPDYNWSEQEELETRFIEILERRFA